MNGATIILGTASGGGAIMIGALLLVIAIFLTVRWLMQKRGA
jgi:flagellar biogenesis protein FliO